MTDRLYTERERLTKKSFQLKQERDKTWLTKWKDQRDYIAPADGQFEGDQQNSGERRDGKINNPRARRSAQICAAGMASGMTSQARPWFEVAQPEGVPQTIAVRTWLYQVQEAIRNTLSKSNVYSTFPQVFHSEGVYGTGIMAGIPDEQNVVRFKHFPTGTYSLATNDKGEIDTFYRCYKMQPRQMAQQFGIDNLSPQVKIQAENGDMVWIDVHHMIEPNPDADMSKMTNTRMPWKSTYWETSQDGVRKGILRQSGFRTFPIFPARWDVNGDNVYGTGPGDVALGKAKELQLLEADKLRIVQQLARPAQAAPASLRGQLGNVVPGKIVYMPDALVGLAMKPIYTPDARAPSMVYGEIQNVENSIREAFYEDLFLMISQSDGTMTAYEVAQRKEEKMLMLGPVVERNNSEFLDPLIAWVFDQLVERSVPYWIGLKQGEAPIPPPPEELQGVELKIEYISILAQAQRAVAVGSIERAVQFTGMLVGAGFADAADKLNVDAAQDEYYEAIGAPPTILRGEDEVAALRQARAQQSAAQQAQEQGLALAQGAKTLSETSTDGDTALSAISSALQQ